MKHLIGAFLGILILVSTAWAQSPSPVPTAPVQLVSSYYGLTAISSTAGAAAQTTLTIPAPNTGLYNYICMLGFNYSQTNTTGTVQTNAVTTSTNFNGFALKYSTAAAVNTDYDWAEIFGEPATGCAKSPSANTATTFVSPSAATNGMFTWYATYFQAP